MESTLVKQCEESLFWHRMAARRFRLLLLAHYGTWLVPITILSHAFMPGDLWQLSVWMALPACVSLTPPLRRTGLRRWYWNHPVLYTAVVHGIIWCVLSALVLPDVLSGGLKRSDVTCYKETVVLFGLLQMASLVSLVWVACCVAERLRFNRDNRDSREWHCR